MKKYCACCGRQIVSGFGKSTKYVTYGPVVFMGCDTFSCYECSQDLDENGMFPEERRDFNE